ncbi:tRNA threonylcarbamoyladenosine dehydratase [Vallitalea guaymasensis]|uniref:tRNA threonylcarbamoyladenosine dehydratase n=1 Tax=Vallitalea guaymasensis TaxID=1185412 RepID=A0A8J8MCK5_9FIRM|nr:tRNA threonylcarbamoyladenosine dehydratase [Vallitalea guaymasensis]QUH30482.1 tRNA threonylcarbamoyladenosine dehydratase [Vallitalea guaymasensis]
MSHAFSRTEMLIGKDGLQKLKNSKVAVFGVGGVGTYVIEGLARSGIGELILIDDDDICVSNINRQLHATTRTVGQAKVDVMKDRILDINNEAKVITYRELYNSHSADRLLSDDYSYVVDAIDMVSSKLDLIERCKKRNIPIISSMGAGNKLNPAMFEVADIYETSVCPLAKVMRKELRNRDIDSLKVVYSKEKPLKPILVDDDKTDSEEYESAKIKRQTPGSVAFVPSVVGLIIASEVVKDLLNF